MQGRRSPARAVTAHHGVSVSVALVIALLVSLTGLVQNPDRAGADVRAEHTVADEAPAARHSNAPATAGRHADDLAATLDALVMPVVGTAAPGAAIAVVDADGPVLTEGYGLADPTTDRPADPATPFPVASVSKVLTSLAALVLDHDGSLDLDDEVAATTTVEPVERRPDTTSTAVTLRHLLTHTAGIAEPLVLVPPTGDGPWDLTERLAEHPPVLAHASGVGLQYSPLQAYTALGVAIERATGGDFDTAVADLVTGPLAMAGTSFDDVAPDTDVEARMATRDGDAWRSAPLPAIPERPAASARMSADDAARLLAALVGADDGLPAEVVDTARETAFRPTHGGGGHTQVFFEADYDGVRVLEHPGNQGMAWLAVVPEAEVGVFVAVNTMDEPAMALAPAVVEAVTAWAVTRGGASASNEGGAGSWPAITPSWASVGGDAITPVGTFHEQVFSARTVEALAVSLVTNQVRVRADGDDLVAGSRRYTPVGDERWCDADGCLAGHRDVAGRRYLLRSDQAMLQTTLVEAPGSLRRGVVGAALVATWLTLGVGLVGWLRGEWRRMRRDRPAPWVARAVLGWSALATAATVGALAVVFAPLLGDTVAWLATDAWSLRLVRTAAWLGAGGALALAVAVVRTWPPRSVLGRVVTAGLALLAVSVQALFALWHLY